MLNLNFIIYSVLQSVLKDDVFHEMLGGPEWTRRIAAVETATVCRTSADHVLKPLFILPNT